MNRLYNTIINKSSQYTEEIDYKYFYINNVKNIGKNSKQTKRKYTLNDRIIRTSFIYTRCS